MEEFHPAAVQPWWQQLRLRDVALGTVVVLLVVLGFLALLAVRSVLVGAFLGVLIATALRPIMARLLQTQLSRPVAASLALGLLLGLAAGTVALIAPMVSEQIRALVMVLPALFNRLLAELATSQLALLRQLAAQLATLGLPGDEAADATLFIGWLATWLPGLERLLIFGASTLLFAYAWLLYRDRSVAELLLWLAPERRPAAEGLWLQLEGRLGAFIRGQITLAAVIGIFSLLGYWLIGLPYALVLALVAGLLEFVPFLGPVLATTLACAVGLSVSFELGLLALLVGLVVQQVENNVLVPRIMQHAVGISPVVTLLAFVGFTALFGLAGGFVAVPLAATLQLLFGAWVDHMTRNRALGPRRDQAAYLRYEIADLTHDLARRLRERAGSDGAQLDDPEEQIEAVLVDLQALLDRSNEVR